MSTEEDFKIAEWHPTDIAPEVESFVNVRPAAQTELDHLAQLWYDGWQDAHAEILPAELRRLRTLDSFRDRLQARFSDVRVIGPAGAPLGLCMIKDDELYQLFVAAEARGTGVAATLIADGEARLAANGIQTAWLACAIGNNRAAKFYEKRGWQRVGNRVIHVEVTNGTYPLEIWRYEKQLHSSSL